ncbi:50S ribosomal protein L10 [Spiroplasma endosymbiont of Anurida maritima]|uniref:50S ribosomal protein L10 n=1 Tax=Spiroplasma endosymbiont of Anurida maritima TaxID=2967972 RepID=UPI0036D3571C
MKPSLIKKEKVVSEIHDTIVNSTCTVAVEYHNISVAEITELRHILRKCDSKIKIYKNNLVNIAVEKAGKKEFSDFLTGPNAFAFTSGDSNTLIKELANFAKKHKALKLKAAIQEGVVLNTAALNEVASLPTKNELLSMFASSLLYPLRMTAIAIKEVASTKTE